MPAWGRTPAHRNIDNSGRRHPSRHPLSSPSHRLLSPHRRPERLSRRRPAYHLRAVGLGRRRTPSGLPPPRHGWRRLVPRASCCRPPLHGLPPTWRSTPHAAPPPPCSRCSKCAVVFQRRQRRCRAKIEAATQRRARCRTEMEATAELKVLVARRLLSPEMEAAAEARKDRSLGAPPSPEIEAMGATTGDGGYGCYDGRWRVLRAKSTCCCHTIRLVLLGGVGGAAHQKRRCFR
jgi:hypothetical protein